MLVILLNSVIITIIYAPRAVRFTLKLWKGLKILLCLSCRGLEPRIVILVIITERALQDDGACQLILVISNMHDHPCQYVLEYLFSIPKNLKKLNNKLPFRCRRRILVSKMTIFPSEEKRQRQRVSRVECTARQKLELRISL